jgi:hypothetical protein
MSRRWLLWLAAIAGLGALVIHDRRGPTDQAVVVEMVAQAPRPGSPPSAATPRVPPLVLPELIARDRLLGPAKTGTAKVDLFSGRAWVAPSPVAVTPAPVASQPMPEPPPAFTYVGKRRDEQGWQVYLGSRDLTLIAREGETLTGGFVVESIRPPTLTLVRSDRKLQIAIGEWE